MTNTELATILKQDVDNWNKWRKDNPEEGIYLANVDLSNLDLTGANLRGAILVNANLTKANLEGADLTDANLTEAILSEAILRMTDLEGANLNQTNLSKADLRKADLRKADLRKADLKEACLAMANLTGANLREATLSNVDLKGANLIQANLSEANITGVGLYGTARDDWVIDGIQCEYVYWDYWNEERTPRDRNLRQGEFEELYKSLPTFEYYFEHGFNLVDIAVMDRVVQAINERQPELNLQLQSFEQSGVPHATFTVIHKEPIEDAKKQLAVEYEAKLKVLEGQKEQLMQVIKMLGSGGVTIHSVTGGVDIRQAGEDIVGGDKITSEIKYPMENYRGSLRIYALRGGDTNEIGSFLNDLQYVYNNLYFFHLRIQQLKRREISLKQAMSPVSELHSFVPSEHRLVVQAVRIESPGFWDFLANLNPLVHIREYLKERHERRKDKEWREAQEHRRMILENIDKETDIRSKQTELLSKEIDVLRKINATDDEIRMFVMRHCSIPLGRIDTYQDSEMITSAEIVDVKELSPTDSIGRDAS